MLQLLKLLITVGHTATRAGAMRMAVARAAAFALALLIAVTLGLAALGFGLYAAFAFLAPVTGAAAAAAIVAAVLLTAALGVVAIAWRRFAAPKARRTATKDDAQADGDGLPSLVRLLERWARANPWEATAAALTIGFAIGSRR